MGDYRTTSGEAPPVSRKTARRRRLLIAMCVLLLVGGIVAAGILIKVERYASAKGYVTTEEFAEVRPVAAGTVAEIVARTGEYVEAGALLVQLDATEEKATLEEAQAKVEKFEIDLKLAQSEGEAQLFQRRFEQRERKQTLSDAVTKAILQLKSAEAKVGKFEVDLKLQQAEGAAQIFQRQFELGDRKQALADEIKRADLQLKSAQSKVVLAAQLVEKGLKAKTSLDDEELRAKLAQTTLDSLLAKDLTVYDRLIERDTAIQEMQLEAMREELKGLREAVKLAEATRDSFQAKDLTAYDRVIKQDAAIQKMQLEAMREELKGLREATKRAQSRFGARQIRAPIAGRLHRYEFVIGELVRPESVLFEIHGGKLQVLKLNVGERYSAKVAVGHRYSAVLAPYRGVNTIYFKGQIKTLRKFVQAEGKVTYRRAYCDFDSQGLEIQPGTTAEARIYYGRSCLWYYLFNIDS